MAFLLTVENAHVLVALNLHELSFVSRAELQSSSVATPGLPAVEVAVIFQAAPQFTLGCSNPYCHITSLGSRVI